MKGSMKGSMKESTKGSRKGWIKPAVLAAVLVSTGSVGLAAAHSRDDWGHGRCEQRHEGHGFMRGEHRFEPGRHIEGSLAYLKAELKITADQEGAWQKFADVVRENVKARTEMWQSRRQAAKEPARDERPGATERLDRRLQAMEQNMGMFRNMTNAAKTLYAQLSPEQQALADQMLAPPFERHFRF